MKAPRLSFGPAAARSFTLVEMMVSIAILSLILLVLFSLLEFAGSAWSQGQRRIDNFTRARAMLDLIAGDIQHGVFRPDLPAFGTGNAAVITNGISVLTNSTAYSTNAFYTRRAGVGSGVRDLSLVVYYMDPATNATAALNRSYLPVPWTTAGTWASVLPFQTNLAGAISLVTPMDTAPGVVGFELLFLRSDGTLTNAYTGYQASNPVVGVAVGLAVVDSQTMQMLVQQNELATLQSALADALTGTNSPKTDWDSLLNTGAFYQSYPVPLRAGIKTFERNVFCEPSF